MSRENVERLRAYLEEWNPKPDIEAWKRGDPAQSAIRFLSLVDPEVAFEDHTGMVGTYHGYEGIVRATEGWLEPFESLHIELERIVGTGERLVSIHRVQAKARHSGIEFESPQAYVWTFRDRKVIHIHAYVEPAEALEAAGLEE